MARTRARASCAARRPFLLHPKLGFSPSSRPEGFFPRQTPRRRCWASRRAGGAGRCGSTSRGAWPAEQDARRFISTPAGSRTSIRRPSRDVIINGAAGGDPPRPRATNGCSGSMRWRFRQRRLSLHLRLEAHDGLTIDRAFPRIPSAPSRRHDALPRARRRSRCTFKVVIVEPGETVERPGKPHGGRRTGRSSAFAFSTASPQNDRVTPRRP